MEDLQVRWWPIDRPIPYTRNSRKIPERAIDKVAASIKEFGWRQAIVVDKDIVITCGQTRLLSARKLGLKHIPVHFAENLTPAQVIQLGRMSRFLYVSVMVVATMAIAYLRNC